MRDAFGGAFLIKLFLVFIFIYICLTAMALNYAKAFKVKDGVISYLEENEITDISSLTAEEIDMMEQYFEEEFVGKRGYNLSEYRICENISYDETKNKKCFPMGIIIQQAGEATNTKGIYHTVSTYISWKIPFINKILDLNGNNKQKNTVSGLWEIKGQTRIIVNE